MASGLFISYRRDDSAGYAGRLYDRLEREFGRDHVVMDIDSIPLGANFAKVLGDEVAKCDLLLAVIGPGWVEARDEEGKRRLENPQDFVRIEIGTALKRGIPVIPILLEGTRIPKADQLPDDLKELTLRNGLNVRHVSFLDDLERLLRGLKREARRRAEEEAQCKAAEEAEAKRKAEEQLAAAEEAEAKRKAEQETQRKAAEEAEARRKANRYRAEGRIKVDAKIVHGAPDGWFLPGSGKIEWFKDHETGPEMVIVPAGTFMMGSPESEPQRSDAESPQHQVTIARPFAIGRHAVTRGQFAAFVNKTGYKSTQGWLSERLLGVWHNPGFPQDDSHPVVCVTWEDAKAFATWLSSQTGRDYRLLTEAEWEYAGRAGTTTPFWWGSTICPVQANYDGNKVYWGGGTKGEYRNQTVAVGEFVANPWGLYQVHGNVWELCEDVWHGSYNGAPVDGLSWLQGGEAKYRVVRGGSWINNPGNLRSANRNRNTSDDRNNDVGFRVGRTLAARADAIMVASGAP